MNLNKYNFGLSFGTYLLYGSECHQAIASALNYGYRSIDTAELHKNQKDIAIGLEMAYKANENLSRNDIFITSKIHNYNQRDGTILEGIQKIISELNLNDSYIDCIMLHSPYGNYYVESWKELCKYKEQFNIRHIGVSNFSVQHMEKIYDATGIHPAINQLELHPRNKKHQLPIIEYCNENGIVVQAHSAVKSYIDVNENLAASVEDIIKWYCHNKYPTIIKSKSDANIKSNMAIYNSVKDSLNFVASEGLLCDDDFFRFDRFKY